jgi:hypothetical protein
MNENQFTDGPEIFTLEEIVKSVFAFEDLIRQKQAPLQLPPGSPIETAALAALEMLETFRRNVPHDTKRDHRNAWRQAIALADILRKVLRVAGHPRFDQIWPHLLLLLGKSNIALNVWNPKEDQDANKVFELYMALVLAPLCSDLELEDPKHSASGKNPDVIASLNGSRWAFACKVMHSPSPNAFIQRVREGIKQIQRSNADKGVVVVSLKNLLPHDEYWTVKREVGIADLIYSATIDPAVVTGDLLAICAGYHGLVIHELLGGPAAFNDLFKDTKAVPAVLLHLCTTVGAMTSGKPTFHYLRMFCSLNADPLPADLLATMEKLNQSLHGRVAPPAATTN